MPNVWVSAVHLCMTLTQVPVHIVLVMLTPTLLRKLVGRKATPWGQFMSRESFTPLYLQEDVFAKVIMPKEMLV